MDGSIDEKGHLYIKRRNKFRSVMCPHDVDNHCGDWCVLFSEPIENVSESDLPTGILTYHLGHIVKLCGGKVLYFDKLEDRRDWER